MLKYVRSVMLFMVLIAIHQEVCALEDEKRSESEQNEVSEIKKKYNISVCAIFKNEAKYLKEWIEYHRLIGIDHFYLYNNSSSDAPEKILLPYIRDGSLTLIHWPDRTFLSDSDEAASHWALSTQLPAYEHAAKWASLKDTKWLLFLDIDEFLVPVQSSSILDILEKYDGYPGIQVTSEYFEASSSVNILPKRDLLISTIELTSQPSQRIQTAVEKMIIKPDCHSYFTWPPYRCHFKNGISSAIVKPRELRINKYVNRPKSPWKFGKIKEKIDIDHRELSEEVKRDLLERGFEMDDREKAIFKYIPQLRRKMGFE